MKLLQNVRHHAFFETLLEALNTTTVTVTTYSGTDEQFWPDATMTRVGIGLSAETKIGLTEVIIHHAHCAL